MDNKSNIFGTHFGADVASLTQDVAKMRPLRIKTNGGGHFSVPQLWGKQAVVSLISTKGKTHTVHQGLVPEGHNIHVKGLPSGLYVVQVETSDKVYMQKLYVKISL